MITVILLEPEHPGNIGAVARVMKNFDFTELILINPQCDHLDPEAIKRSKHALSILKKAKVTDKKILEEFDYLVATTCKLGTDCNIRRSPLTPDKFAKITKSKKVKIGLIFGREGIGLINDEIAMCDYTVSIPTSKKYPALNLSHSVAIILYEIYKMSGENKITKHFIFASKTEKDQMQKMFNSILDKLDFSTPEKKETQKRVWKKIFGKAMLTRREAYAVMGFFRKFL